MQRAIGTHACEQAGAGRAACWSGAPCRPPRQAAARGSWQHLLVRRRRELAPPHAPSATRRECRPQRTCVTIRCCTARAFQRAASNAAPGCWSAAKQRSMASKQTHVHCSRCSAVTCATSARHSVLLPAPGRPHSASKQAGACCPCDAMRCSLDAAARADASTWFRSCARRVTDQMRRSGGRSAGRWARLWPAGPSSAARVCRTKDGTFVGRRATPAPVPVRYQPRGSACLRVRLRERSPHSLPWRCARRRVSCSATAASAS